MMAERFTELFDEVLFCTAATPKVWLTKVSRGRETTAWEGGTQVFAIDRRGADRLFDFCTVELEFGSAVILVGVAKSGETLAISSAGRVVSLQSPPRGDARL